MIRSDHLQWLLTVLFAAATAFHLVRCIRPGVRRTMAAAHRLSEALHAIMGAAMIVMIWPWGEAVPVAVWVTVFAVSAGWFATGVLRSARRRSTHVFFATVMGAMIWMAALTPAPTSAGHAHHMTGTNQALTAGAVITAALGTYLVAASIWWVARGVHIGGLSAATATAMQQPLRWSALCHAMMSAGMGLALLAMA
jgi:hypothetical protein